MENLQERKVTSAEQRAEQLQRALDSRIVIEQATGIVSAETGLSVQDAFEAIRRHARTNNLNIHDVAQSIIDRGARSIILSTDG